MARAPSLARYPVTGISVRQYFGFSVCWLLCGSQHKESGTAKVLLRACAFVHCAVEDRVKRLVVRALRGKLVP